MWLLFASSILFLLIAHVESMPRIARVIPNAPVDYSFMQHHRYLLRKTAREAHAIVNHEEYHQRDVVRSSPAESPTAAPIEPPAASSKAAAVSTSSNTWLNQTSAACIQSLTALNGKASNPSGLAACYNVKSWNSSTGVFEADLRLYRIAAATGDWVTLMTQAVNVGLSYSGATVAPSGGNNKRSEELPSRTPTDSRLLERSAVRRTAVAAPSLVQDMNFVGKVNKDFMGQVKNTTKAQGLLVPRIALSASDKNGKVITTVLSSNEASFVNGVFADSVKTSTSAGIPASSAAANAGIFVLPGRTLGIFPVGLIITGAWTLMFIMTVGYGTIERIRFREAYRRRVKYRIAANARLK
ncbi:MAG: hypothetical protein LQ343_007276 [Gyalolechia ehrenbergii]|nr:MAG: hypothetical protein LQ343_007276 [Gyalolechia ehrenbergii]